MSVADLHEISSNWIREWWTSPSCVKRLSSIWRTWPSHRRRDCWMISAKLLALSVDLKILWRTPSLVIFCFQQICPMVLRYLWSKTCSLWRSSARIGHVSQPYMSVGRTVQLYTQVNKDMSVRRQRWRHFPNTARALEIRDVISSVMLPLALQLPRYVKLSTKSNSSSLRVSGVIEPVQFVCITLHFGSKLNPYLPAATFRSETSSDVLPFRRSPFISPVCSSWVSHQ